MNFRTARNANPGLTETRLTLAGSRSLPAGVEHRLLRPQGGRQPCLIAKDESGMPEVSRAR